jgi:hypothetical protein
MENNMNRDRLKAVIDLHEYLDSIGQDRPPLGVFLKGLNIEPQTMQDAVMQTAHAASITIPSVSFEIVNYLFKLGVTVGYKYALKREMEKVFGDLSEEQSDIPPCKGMTPNEDNDDE